MTGVVVHRIALPNRGKLPHRLAEDCGQLLALAGNRPCQLLSGGPHQWAANRQTCCLPTTAACMPPTSIQSAHPRQHIRRQVGREEGDAQIVKIGCALSAVAARDFVPDPHADLQVLFPGCCNHPRSHDPAVGLEVHTVEASGFRHKDVFQRGVLRQCGQDGDHLHSGKPDFHKTRLEVRHHLELEADEHDSLFRSFDRLGKFGREPHSLGVVVLQLN
mmetsp:Transcript_56849/g.165032  ORF Transcript_56849/g.165032 Transcript_56849/m.165032 type:complete len:218 (+) Transcript_56849:268-921(+)